MKRIYPNREWPESWKLSYDYDLLEIYGDKSSLGYVYAYQKRFNTTLGLIQSALPRGSSVIDIAAGQGNFSLTLAELGYKVVWNDFWCCSCGWIWKALESKVLLRSAKGQRPSTCR